MDLRLVFIVDMALLTEGGAISLGPYKTSPSPPGGPRRSAGLFRQPPPECCGRLRPRRLQFIEKAIKRIAKHLERALPLWSPSRSKPIRYARLETKNDESRFGLTRAPFLQRRGSLERGQSLVRHRVAKSGIESTVKAHT